MEEGFVISRNNHVFNELVQQNGTLKQPRDCDDRRQGSIGLSLTIMEREEQPLLETNIYSLKN